MNLRGILTIKSLNYMYYTPLNILNIPFIHNYRPLKNNIMKNLLILLLLCLSIIVKAQETQLTKEEKIYGLSLIWQEVNYNFAYMENYKLDWDSLYIANIPKVVAAKNLTEYYAILSGIMNSFHERTYYN